MAIIKCPECGRQISENAPTCPYCGVEIKGKITRCTQCGEVYFNDQEVCPNCHHITYKPQSLSSQPTAEGPSASESGHGSQTSSGAVPPPLPGASVPSATSQQASPAPKEPKKSNAAVILAIAATIALLLGGIFWYFYNSAKTEKEIEAYEFAIKSDDPLVLQTYLDNNMDAPNDHRDAVTAKLEALKKQDNDWQNAVVSSSKAALEDYVAKHPESEHVTEARHLIDSIDWAGAQNENTLEALQGYIDAHINGEHVTEANQAIKIIKSKTVQSEEKSAVVGVLRKFFQSVNSRNEEQLQASVAPVMTNFLGKADATQADVVTFLHKIYKEDITNMNWKLNGDYKIDKREVGEDRYEFTVKYGAVQEIERGEGNVQSVRYQITSVVSPDKTISSMSMTKLVE